MQANLRSQSSGLILDGLEGLLGSETSLNAADTAGSTTPSQDWTVEETAKVLGLSRGAVIRRLEDGILPGYRVKRGHTSAWRVKPIWQEQKSVYREALKTEESPPAKSMDDESENLISFNPAAGEALDETQIASPEDQLDENTVLVHNAKQKLSQEQIEFDKQEAASDGNLDIVEVYEADEETENSSAIPLSTYKELIELRTKLALSEMQFHETREKLESANHKIGYLEARIDFGQEQLKLLTDSKHKQSWWERLCSSFRA